jgi:hypothetical protein
VYDQSVAIGPDILERIEAELEAERARLREEMDKTIARHKPRIDGLVRILDEMHRLMPDSEAPPARLRPDGKEVTAEGSGGGAASEASPNSDQRLRTYRGRPNVPAVVLDLLDEQETDFGALYERICAHPAYEGRKPPSRRGVNNRVNEMAHDGAILKVRRNVFKGLPPSAGGAGKSDDAPMTLEVERAAASVDADSASAREGGNP